MIFLVAILSIATSVAEAQEGFVAEKSAHGVTDTVDRLEAVLDEKGVTVFARVDHADGAREAGMELRPTELLIFGTMAGAIASFTAAAAAP